jgi:uncharacterized membrane protein
MRLTATILFVLCAALLLRVALTDQQMLPDRMASHFDANGVPNGWSSKSSFTWNTLALGMGIPAFVIGIMYSIRFAPPKFLNVPNPTYWREPQNFRKACDCLFTSSLWFGSAFLVWQAFFSHTIAKANQLSPPHLDSGKVFLLTLPLLVFTFGWVIALLLRFLKTPDSPSPGDAIR